MAALVHMYKSMENHLDERFGPVEDFFIPIILISINTILLL